jgi:hypothetical protein
LRFTWCELFRRTVFAMTDQECDACLGPLRQWLVTFDEMEAAERSKQSKLRLDPQKTERIRRSGLRAIRGGAR